MRTNWQKRSHIGYGDATHTYTCYWKHAKTSTASKALPPCWQFGEPGASAVGGVDIWDIGTFGTSETFGSFWASGASAVSIGGLVLGQEEKKDKNKNTLKSNNPTLKR